MINTTDRTWGAAVICEQFPAPHVEPAAALRFSVKE